MKLYLARHGQTNYNDLHLCNADPSVDVQLTPVGIKQADVLAGKLKSVHLDHIFASELPRTQQTAEIINRFHNLKIEIDTRLGDHRSGFEGKHFKELMGALDAADNRWTARFNGGESIEDIKQRVASFINDLQANSYHAVLVITSQWVIRAIAAIVQDISNEEAWELEVSQGSCMELEIDANV
ncbi:histidine phosphatase family protein [Candidatus Saccharibacteria bacterium]|nr:histidine phosphatase family protein [Candidatus Saccharibacteria bacterium]